MGKIGKQSDAALTGTINTKTTAYPKSSATAMVAAKAITVGGTTTLLYNGTPVEVISATDLAVPGILKAVQVGVPVNASAGEEMSVRVLQGTRILAEVGYIVPVATGDTGFETVPVGSVYIEPLVAVTATLASAATPPATADGVSVRLVVTEGHAL